MNLIGELASRVTEALVESLHHAVPMLPVMFGAFILMEFVNHNTRASGIARITKNRAIGPLVAAGLGLLPQCGFSVAATTLFLEGLIPAGSLLATYIATSDEAVPILLADRSTLPWVAPLLLTKLVWGTVAGVAVNMALATRPQSQRGRTPGRPACAPENGTWRDHLSHAFHRTLRIGSLVVLFSTALHLLGQGLSETLGSLGAGRGLLGPVATSFVGLIPSCATSVALAEGFKSGVLSFPAMVSGLTANAGLGLLVLIKESRRRGEALSIIASLVASAAIAGLLATLLYPA